LRKRKHPQYITVHEKKKLQKSRRAERGANNRDLSFINYSDTENIYNELGGVLMSVV